MLNGPRFDFRANQQYRFDAHEWNRVKTDPKAMIDIVQWFIQDHYKYQVPRLLTLERYYNGDNDILYWMSEKAPGRADNRIPSGLPHYSTDINTGYELGNELTYSYSNSKQKSDTGKDILDLIEECNNQNDMGYHDKMMGKNIHNTGRAYELEYIKPRTHDIAVRLIDPVNAFVVYDTTMARHSLFGVHYYLIDYMDTKSFYAEVYTDSETFYFKIDSDPSGEMHFIEREEHFMFDEPLTEFNLNDERMGLWERKLATVDAIDKSNSEMANSQEDFSNAILAISGDIDVPDDSVDDDDTDDDELPMPPEMAARINLHDRIMFLKPQQLSDGQGGYVNIPTSAEYLTKELNADAWKLYIDHLVDEFHKETYTPDMSDEEFAGNSTGVALGYKLLATDQERSIFETLFKRGIMRRLRLMSNYWSFIELLHDETEVNNVIITFNPNLPKVTSETIQNLTSLGNLQAFSKQTIREKAEDFTGVSAEAEDKRVRNEQQQAIKDGLQAYNDNFGTDQEKAGVGDGSNSSAENSKPDQSGQ